MEIKDMTDFLRIFPRRLFLLLFFSALMLMGGPALADDALTWQRASDMLTSRTALGVATPGNGYVYAVGGYHCEGNPTPGCYLKSAEYYSLSQNTWTAVADLPQGRYFHGAAGVNGKIYVAGGRCYDGANPILCSGMVIYDPATNTWSSGPALQYPRFGPAVVGVGDEVWIIGGVEYTSFPSGNSYSNRVEIFDTKTNTLRLGTNLPEGRDTLAAASLNGKVYVAGGTNTSRSPWNEAYDFYVCNDGAWEKLANLPTRRWSHAAVGYAGRIYLFGGEEITSSDPDGSTTKSKTVIAYDPSTNAWSSVGDMLNYRIYHAAVVEQGRIFIVGGSDLSQGNWYYASAILDNTDVSARFTTTPLIQVKPTNLDFGFVLVESTKDLSLTVKNVGGGTLAGNATTAAPFSVLSGGSYSLGPDQEQVVTIRYLPTSPGTHTSTVVFTGGTGVTVPVAGETATPVIQVTPISLNFRHVPVGSTKDLSLTVKNTGTGTLAGNATTAAPFSVISGGSYSLGANQEQVVTIRYQPTSPGAPTGTVVFTGGSGATVPVTVKPLTGLSWLLLLLGN
jgi:N-acetylneuraminic acid mutarotase